MGFILDSLADLAVSKFGNKLLQAGLADHQKAMIGSIAAVYDPSLEEKIGKGLGRIFNQVVPGAGILHECQC